MPIGNITNSIQSIVMYHDITSARVKSMHCEKSACGHFSGDNCSLGRRVKSGLPPVVDALPSCLIRPSCRWYAEQGGEVCLRCPQVVTMIPAGDNALNQVAVPR